MDFSRDGLVFRVVVAMVRWNLFAIIVVIAGVFLNKAKSKVDKRHDRN